MYKALFSFILLCFSFFQLKSQNASCITALPFCSGSQYNIEMPTNTFAESGPNYGCLDTQPNPMWYFLRVTQPGDIIIHMQSTPNVDVDFACWGPFNDPVSPCTALLTSNCNSSGCPDNTQNSSFYPSGNMVDCSYDAAYYEDCHILNAIQGKYYLICLLNYSNHQGRIIFEQSNTANINSGRAACVSNNCHINFVSSNFTQCDSISNTTKLYCEAYFGIMPDSGMMYIKENGDTLITESFPLNQNPYIFHIDSIQADGQNHNYQILITPDYCIKNINVNAPLPCSNHFCFAGDDFNACGLQTNLNATIVYGYTNSHWHSCPGIIFEDTLNSQSEITANNYGVYSLIWENTNQFGQTNYDTVNVNFIELPVSSFSLSQPICFGDTVIAHYNGISTSISNISWNFYGGTGIANANFPDQDINWSTAGNHQISLTVESNGCTSTSTNSVNIPQPLDIIISNNLITCSSGTTSQLSFNTINASNPVSYTYMEGNPPFITGIYHVIATDHNGCTAIDTFTVTSNTTIINTNIYPPLCNGSNNGDIAAIVTTPHPPVSYHWSNNQNTDSISHLTAGTYILTVTDSQGCSLTTSVVLPQPAAITINYIKQNPACYGSGNGKITLNPTGGTPPYLYLWYNGNTSNEISNLNPGTYNVTITDANHCTKTSSFVISNPPSINITGTILSDCENTCNGSIILNITNATNPINYIWSGGSNTNLCAGNYTVTVTDSLNCTSTQSFTITSSSNTMNPTVSFNTNSSCLLPCNGSVNIYPNGGTAPYKIYYEQNLYSTFTTNNTTINNLCPGNYSNIIIDNNNCFSSANYMIDTTQTPVITLISPHSQIICLNESITLNATGTGDTSYWSNSINNNVPFIPSSTGTYEYVFTSINLLSGCQNIDTAIVKVNPNPINHIYSNQYICSGNYITLVANNGNSYSWSNGVQQGVPFIPLTSNYYYVTVSNAFNCTTIDSAKIFVTPNPIPVAGNDTTVCQNSPAILNATGGYTYYWNNGVSQNTSFIPISSGFYTVTVANSYNCTSIDSLYITVNPNPSANAGHDTSVCIFNSVVLMATGGDSYSWSNGVQQGIPFTPSTSEYYYVTVVDVNNCSAIDSIYIAVGNPVIDAGNDIQLCYPDTIILHATASEGVISWNNGVIQDVPFFVNQSDIFIATITDSIGCTNSDLILVDIVSPQTPVINFSNDTLYSSIHSGNQWYKENIAIPGANNDYYIPLITGNYSVITEINNCLSDTSNQIFVNMSVVNHLNSENIKVYPNPANEYLIIENYSNMNECIIYNSLGQKIETVKLDNSKTSIHTLNFSNGIYFIVMQNKDNYFKQIFEIKK